VHSDREVMLLSHLSAEFEDVSNVFFISLAGDVQKPVLVGLNEGVRRVAVI